MRRGVVLAIFVVAPMGAAFFVACGLDESGAAGDGSVDVTTKDGAPADVIADVPIDVPQACSTLDATACFDAGLPDGWTFAAVAPGDIPCPTSDFTKTPYIHDPTADGGCQCTCTSSGSLDCSGQVEAGTQPSCNGSKSFTFDAGNDAACIDTGWGDPHIAVGPPPLVGLGTASCDASAPPPAWSAGNATACTPSCTANYCGVASPYERCIISTTSTTCPAPFTKQEPSLGTNAQVTASCTGCACAINTSVSCNATVIAYDTAGCVGPIDAAPSNGTCESFGNVKVNSFRYTPVIPSPQCAITASGTGTASFTQSITVCCLP